jgi:hypothetical protein
MSATDMMLALMAVVGMYSLVRAIVDLRAGRTIWGASGLILAATVALFFFAPMPWGAPKVDIDYGAVGQ